MSRHNLPVDVPCGVCLVRTVGWRDTAGDLVRARPCGHFLSEINEVGVDMLRSRPAFGQYAGPEGT
jgi:hypothetical protein